MHPLSTKRTMKLSLDLNKFFRIYRYFNKNSWIYFYIKYNLQFSLYARLFMKWFSI